jgi:hypothetical protein
MSDNSPVMFGHRLRPHPAERPGRALLRWQRIELAAFVRDEPSAGDTGRQHGPAERSDRWWYGAAEHDGRRNPADLMRRTARAADAVRDPWANDPDRTTRHYAVSIPPPTTFAPRAGERIPRIG